MCVVCYGLVTKILLLILVTIWRVYAFNFVLNFGPQLRGKQKNNQLILIMCPPPRKSLVKGERFIRSEGRPE